MQIKFKPKFWKDIARHKDDAEIMSTLLRVFANVEKAGSTDEINNIKPLEKFNSRFRIKLSLDKKRDFRIGTYVHGKRFGSQDSYHEQKFTKKTGE